MKFHERLEIRLLVNMSIICRSSPVWLINRHRALMEVAVINMNPFLPFQT